MNQIELPRQEQTCHSLFTSHQWFDFFGHFVNYDKQNFSLPLTPLGGSAFFSCDKSAKRGNNILESMTNYYSPIYGLAGESVDISPSIDSVQQHREIFSAFDYVNVLPLYKKQAEQWCEAFSYIGFKGFTYQHSVNWYEKNITSLDDYWQRRPSKLKNTLKRKQDLINKDNKFNVRIVSKGNNEILLQALIDYHQVYYHSWKRPEPKPSFIDCVCLYLWQNNALRLGLIYYDNQPIAAQIWFVHNQTAQIFKLAYHKEFTRYSPGTVLTAALLQHVISQDSVSEIDFLTGNDEYKKDWMTENRPLYGVQLCNMNRWRGQARAFINFLSDFKSK